jgi:hypothetical protein
MLIEDRFRLAQVLTELVVVPQRVLVVVCRFGEEGVDLAAVVPAHDGAESLLA